MTLEYLQPERKIAAKLKFENGRNIFGEINGSDIKIVEGEPEPIGPVEDFGSCVVRDPDGLKADLLYRFGVLDGYVLAVAITMDGRFENTIWEYGQEKYNFIGSSFDIADGLIFWHDLTTHEVIACVLDDLTSPLVDTIIYHSGYFSELPLRIAAVSQDEIYVFPMSETVNAGFGITYVNFDGTTKVWDGWMYDGNNSTHLHPNVGAVRFDERDYIYFTDTFKERSYFISRSEDYWSEVTPIMPIDVLDDMAKFVFGGVSIVNGEVYVCGQYARSNSNFDFLVYLRGPEDFSMGRDILIAPTNGREFGGSHLEMFGDYLIYSGIGYRFFVEPNSSFGYGTNSQVTETEEIINLTISKSGNNAASLTAELKNDYSHISLEPGAIATLYSTFNDVEYKVGTFDIDGVIAPDEGSSRPTQIVARSLSMKRMNRWESDASYDYWSQTKLATNPKDLADVIQVTGSYEEDTVFDGLKSKDLNVDGVMYANEKSGRGGQIAARFIHNNTYVKIRNGVALNYYRETKGQVAERLGIEYEDVEETNYGHSGIFALVEDLGAGIVLNLYYVHDNSWELQISEELPYLAYAEYWLMMTFRDGRIKVFFRQNSTVWTEMINTLFTHDTWLPWKRSELINGDQLGRGAILLNGLTFTSTTTPFRSDDDYVPVLDNSGFRIASELPPYAADKAVAKVGEELITYTTRSKNEYITGLTLSPGELVTSNTEFTPETMVKMVFADTRERNFCRQTLYLPVSKYVTAVSVYVAKENYPDDGLMIALHDKEETASSPLGVRKIRNNVPSEEISSDGDWLTVMFDKPTYMRNGDSITMTRGKDAANPSSLAYYSAYCCNNPGYPGGLFQLFDEREPDETSEPDTWHYGVMPPQDLLFKAYALPVAPTDSYFVMIDTVPELNTTADYYVDMALYAYEGAGTGNSYRIVKYTWGAQVCMFYIERKPSAIGIDTKFSVVPTLLGLTRTNPMAHSKEKIDWYPEAPATTIMEVRYFTSEIDKSLADLAESIARKSGAFGFTADQTFSNLIDPATNTETINRKNVMLKIGIPSNQTGTIIFSARDDYLNLEVNQSGLTMKEDGVITESIGVSGINGWVLISFYNEFVSVWCNNQLIHSFVVTETEGTEFKIIGDDELFRYRVVLREADIREDNFLLDTGTTGAQLLSRLVGEKRYYYEDDTDGNLRIFSVRKDINDWDSPYVSAIQTASTKSDNGIVTRLRVEGAEIYERVDEAAALLNGNIYRELNTSEVYSINDAEYYSDVILDDLLSQGETRSVGGPVDLRVFPNGVYYILLPTLTGGVKQQVIVDEVSFNLGVSRDGISFDMNFAGRVIGKMEVVI